jgi:hypothetical protein
MKILKWIGVVVLGIPVLLVASIYTRNKAVGPQGWAEDDTIKKLQAKMKDPDSMVIRSSFFVWVNKGDYTEIRMCGIVDGKNSFGGYTGGSRFVSVSRSYKDTFDNFIVELDNSSASDRAAAERIGTVTPFEKVYWNEYCVDESHPALVPST